MIGDARRGGRRGNPHHTCVRRAAADRVVALDDGRIAPYAPGDPIDLSEPARRAHPRHGGCVEGPDDRASQQGRLQRRRIHGGHHAAMLMFGLHLGPDPAALRTATAWSAMAACSSAASWHSIDHASSRSRLGRSTRCSSIRAGDVDLHEAPRQSGVRPSGRGDHCPDRGVLYDLPLLTPLPS